MQFFLHHSDLCVCARVLLTLEKYEIMVQFFLLISLWN